MPKYDYIMRGRAARRQTWRSAGTVEAAWSDVFHVINQKVFMELTEGTAEFGRPGVGCSGPYTMVELNIEVNEDDQFQSEDDEKVRV